MKYVQFTSGYIKGEWDLIMSRSYATENTELSDLLAQLLEPPIPLSVDPNQNDRLTEESDLALTLRLLLGHDPVEP
jgi:hypothetical protein